MNLEELKATWEKAGATKRSQQELRLMTEVKHHPQLKQVRRKLLVESGLLIFFLLVYYDMLDGRDKPLWVNTLLVLSILLFITNDVLGYRSLLNPLQGNNIVNSLHTLHTRLKRLFLLSMSTSISFTVSLLAFFLTGSPPTPTKYLLLLGMVITFSIMTYLSARNWQSRIDHINSAALEFKQEAK